MKWIKTLTLMLLPLMGCQIQNPPSSDYDGVHIDLPEFNEKVENFPSCQELYQYLESQNAIYQSERDRYLSYVHSENNYESYSLSASASPPDITNAQESEVQESDFAKTIEDTLFVAHGPYLEIISLTTQKITHTMELKDWNQLELIVYKNKLILIAQKNYDSKDFTPTRSFLPETTFYYNKTYTIQIFNWNRSQLLLEKEFLLQGQNLTTRQYKNELLIVYNRLHHDLNEEECQNTTQPAYNDFDLKLTELIQIPLTESDKLKKQSYVGGFDTLYITPHNTYTYKASYSWMSWDNRTNYPDRAGFLYKIPHTSEGKVTRIPIAGKIQDRWSLKETRPNEITFVESQNHSHRIKAYQQANSQILLDKQSPPFAYNEELKAVRYVDQKAYVVTFRNYDPLFAFDLSHPNEIVLEDELTLPGFSEYLHPTRQGLVGLGQSTSGGFSPVTSVKVSWFQTQPQLEEVDHMVFDETRSFSEMSDDTRGFLYLEKWDLFGFPLTQYKKDPNNYGKYQVQPGFQLISLHSNHQLEKKALLSHWEYLSPECQNRQKIYKKKTMDVSRMFSFNQHLVAISQAGVSFHSRTQPEEKLSFILFDHMVCPAEPFYPLMCGTY